MMMPLQPACRARRAMIGLRCIVKTRIGRSAPAARRRWISRTPASFASPMVRSTTITSGRNRRHARKPCDGQEAALTSQSMRPRVIRSQPSATTGWSSTISTRSGVVSGAVLVWPRLMGKVS
ncbi:hypothetical protein D3C76_1572490 [compost metagenome]